MSSILVLCLTMSVAYGQYRANLRGDQHLWHLSVDNWTTDDGLLSNTLLEVVQTPDGFLWLASYDGLMRFDGVQFEGYGKQQIKQLNSNAVYCLSPSKDSTLWIGTHGSGLLAYKNGKFEQFGDSSAFIQSLLVDEYRHSVWVGLRGDGLLRYDWVSKLWHRIKHPALNGHSILDIQLTSKGRLWVATNYNEVPLLSYYQGKFQEYKLADSQGDLQIRTLFINEKNDELLIGTDRGIYRREGDQINRLEMLPKDVLVNHITSDASGSIWIGCLEGLIRWDTYTNKLEWLKSKWGKKVQNIYHAFQGREGSIWIASYRKGLFRIKDSNFYNLHFTEGGIVEYPITAIGAYKPGEPIVGDSNGKLYTIREGVLKKLPIKTVLPKTKIYQIIKDQEGAIWIATYQGVLKLIPETGEEYFFGRGQWANGNMRAKSLLADSNGYVWIGTFDNGLFQVEASSGTLIKHYNEDINGFPGEYIMGLEVMPNGHIGISTNGDGFLKLNPQTGKWTSWNVKDGLCSNLIFNSYTDLEGDTWLAANGGIARISSDNKIVNYTYKQGLPNDTPFDFVEDALSNVWLPTGKGIIRVDKGDLNKYANNEVDSITWEIFTKEDGIHYEQCTGASFSWIDENNNLWIPAIGGLTKLKPHSMAYNAFEPPVYIKEFKVGDEPISIKSGEAPEIQSGPKRYTFNYTALSLWAPAKVRFKYKLIGYDQDWVYAGNSRMATYTNLPVGEHTFHVIACNNDGVWNKKGAKIHFEVTPRWYEHPLFLFVVLLVLMALLRALYNWRMLRNRYRQQILTNKVAERTKEIEQKRQEITEQNNLLKEKQYEIEQKNQELARSQKELRELNTNLEEKVEERTRALAQQSKELENTLNRLTISRKELDHFTYQAPHDFRGPIARLLGIIQIARLEADKYALPYLEKLELIAKSMDVMLKKLLNAYELTRYEPIYKQIYVKKAYNSALKRLKSRFDLDKYQLIYIDNGIEGIFSDRELLVTILENLLENSMYYTRQLEEEERRVEMEVEEEEETGYILIHIKDNGIGILPEFHAKVFKAFFKASDISDGNGLGLYLVAKCLEQLEGEANIISKDEDGCCVTIRLKTISSYYS